MSETATKPSTFTITELTREFDVSTRTLWFYEDEGMLHPIRDGRHGFYRPADRVRLKLILRGKRLGFSLSETGQLFELYDADKSSAAGKELTAMAIYSWSKLYKHPASSLVEPSWTAFPLETATGVSPELPDDGAAAASVAPGIPTT